MHTAVMIMCQWHALVLYRMQSIHQTWLSYSSSLNRHTHTLSIWHQSSILNFVYVNICHSFFLSSQNKLKNLSIFFRIQQIYFMIKYNARVCFDLIYLEKQKLSFPSDSTTVYDVCDKVSICQANALNPFHENGLCAMRKAQHSTWIDIMIERLFTVCTLHLLFV